MVSVSNGVIYDRVVVQAGLSQRIVSTPSRRLAG